MTADQCLPGDGDGGDNGGGGGGGRMKGVQGETSMEMVCSSCVRIIS